MQIGKLIRTSMIADVFMPSASSNAGTPTQIGGVIDGKVTTYAGLPDAAMNNGRVYLVTQATGIIFLTKKDRGLYISDGVSWSLIGDWSALLQDSNFTMWDDVDPTRKMRFEISGVGHNTLRIINMPDADVYLGDIAETKNTLASVTSQLMPRGSSFNYDENGRLASVISAVGSKFFVYSDGRLSQVTGTGIFKSKSFIYDENGRLQSISILA